MVNFENPPFVVYLSSQNRALFNSCDEACWRGGQSNSIKLALTVENSPLDIILKGILPTFT